MLNMDRERDQQAQKVHHFPQAVIALLRFHRMWPQNNEYVTVCEMLKTILLYCPTTWFGFATGAHVFVQYLSKLEICRHISAKFSEVVLGNSNIDFTESIVVLFLGIFLSYSFLLYFKQLNEIVDFTKDLENFRQFGEPENLEQFKKKHDKRVKLLYGYCVVGLVVYSAVSYLEEPYCRRKYDEQNAKDVCGFMVPVWIPFDLSDPIIKHIVFSFQACSMLLVLLPAILGTYFAVTCVDLITIRIEHLQNVLENIEVLPRSLKKSKLKWSVQYHVRILRYQFHTP
jgi:hypothetical protein